MSNFDTLLADLETIQAEQATLAKSLCDDGGDKGDEKIAAAAKGGDDKDKDGKDKDEKGGDELTKSLGVITLADGSEVDALDGTLLVKSLLDRMDQTDGQVASVMGAMLGTIKSQGEMIKSMHDEIRALGAQGRGRKAVVTITNKTEGTAVLAKSEAGEGLTAEQFMLKSNAAFDAGKITGRELNLISVTLRANQAVEPALISKVLA